MMTSDGHVEMQTDLGNGERKVEYHSKYPIPEGCDAKKVLKALEKLHQFPADRIKTTDAALLPLTPMEKGFVLGVLTEYQARR